MPISTGRPFKVFSGSQVVMIPFWGALMTIESICSWMILSCFAALSALILASPA